MSKVFISYVRQDEAVAERLYEDLKALGADPWLDKHDLIAGQGWRGAIKQAVRRSSHFIALISRDSVQKRGYAQLEIREALEMLKEIPPDEIYLIPVRLDETVPSYEPLQNLHYVDLFPSYAAGLAQIRKALQASGGIDVSTVEGSVMGSKDAERIKSYRMLYDRAAFQVPCIFEYALVEVDDAIQDISAAMATGKVYSRHDRLLMELSPKSSFETEPYQSTLDDIGNSLSALRRTVATLSNLLCDAANIKTLQEPGFFDMEFVLRHLIDGGVPQKLVMDMLDLMDRVDSERNALLKKLNALLEKSQLRVLPYVTLSSVQLKRSAELERDGGRGPQRWDDFYLSAHRELSKFLTSSDSTSRGQQDL
jgi:hypothetical protein